MQSQNNTAIVPHTAMLNKSRNRRGLTITTKVIDHKQMEALKDELRGILRKSRKVAPKDEDNFGIIDIQEFLEVFDNVTAATYWVVVGISCISLFVGGIGIMNIMIVSVTERTKEIGIRKSLGAKQSSILSQFLSESIVLSVLGGIPGIIAGVGSAYLVLSFMSIGVTISFIPFFIGFGFSVFIGTVSGFIPAYRASRLVPVDALRFD